jgi:thioredoxin 1
MHEVESLEELHDWLNEDGKLLVDVWASWCQPCKRMEPIIHSIDSEYSAVTVLAVEADKHPEILEFLMVSSVPTYIYYEDGSERGRVVGAKPQSILEKQLKMY